MSTPDHNDIDGIERLSAFEQLFFGDDSLLVGQSWPHQAKFSAAAALKESGRAALAKEITVYCRRMRAAKHLPPIISVAGMLNSGKSSIVAGFLSPVGRKRVLRGVASGEGTNRFVFWLPRALRESEEGWDLLCEQLRNVFDGQFEFLSDDPESAHRQYNEVGGDFELFGVPLIATDSALDDLGFGLLDCPDVNRPLGQFDGTKTADKRLEFVARAAVLCSAFLVVAKHDNFSAERYGTLLQEMRERMSGVPLFALINQIKANKYSAAVVRRDVEKTLVRHDIARCFGAFDFDVPGWRERTPQALLDNATDEERCPAFFEILADDASNQPDAVGEDRFLRTLPSTLSKGQLFANVSNALWQRLGRLVGRALGELQDVASEWSKELRSGHEKLLSICVDWLYDKQKDEIRNITGAAEIAKELEASMWRTAPQHFKPALKTGALAKSVTRGLKRAWNIAKMPFEAARKVGEAAEKVGKKVAGSAGRAEEAALEAAHKVHAGEAGNLFTPAEFARKLKVCGLAPNCDDRALEAACSAVIERFKAIVGTLHLDQDALKALDAAMKVMWKRVPWYKHVTVVFTTVLAFGAALAAIADAGLSAVGTQALLSWVAGHLGLTLSAQSAAFIAGGAAGVGGFAATLANQIENQIGLPLFANFFAITCDAFGFPRHLDGAPITFDRGKKKQKLPPSGVPQQPASLPLTQAREWTKNEDTEQRIKKAMHADTAA